MPAALPDKPYNKRDNESQRAYHAFKIYLEMGAERSLEKTRQALGKKSGYLRVIQEWSSVHQWQMRVKAFDEEQARLELEEISKLRLQAKLRRVRQYQQIQEKGIQSIEKLSPEEISPKVALDYVEIGSKGERTELGEPSDITENRTPNASTSTNINIANNTAILNFNKDSLEINPLDIYNTLNLINADKAQLYLDLVLEAQSKWEELRGLQGGTIHEEATEDNS